MAKTESLPSALWEKDIPRGPAFLRVSIKVLGEDNETLLRTETCDVFLESTISYNEEQLAGLGGPEGTAKAFAEQVLTSLLPASEEGPVVTLYRALRRAATYPPKEGKAISKAEARRLELGVDPSWRPPKSQDPSSSPKPSKPKDIPAPKPVDK